MIFVNMPVYAADSTPAPKVGLLKKLLQALQFRKNARAREQARVLNIIARSGLKDSLQATVRVLDSVNTVNRTSISTLQEQSVRDVLNAIDLLKLRLDSMATAVDTSVPEDIVRRPSSSVDPPVDDQQIQDLVNQVIAATDPKEEEHLRSVRSLLFRKDPLTDTVKISDSLSEIRRFSVRTQATVIGLFPYPEGQPNIDAYLRLINELSWYAVGFKGSTGDLTSFNGWNTSAVIDSARARGCRISLCVQSKNEKNITDLLERKPAQQVLIAGVVAALRLRHADGVQIMFDKLPGGSRAAFTSFIIQLAEALKTRDRSYRLGIRVPAYDAEDAYDLATLNVYADQFLLDFTQYQPKAPGPLFPLAGVHNDDLKTSISRILNMEIPPSKLIVCLPYYGVRWKVKPDKDPPEYITYKDLCSDPRYQQLPLYDPLSATQRLDIKNRNGVVTERIWYEDEKTLAAKYDLILQQHLGGIAIQALGYDEGYGELWDVLASRFARVDTMASELKTLHPKPKVLDDWQWSWAYIGAKLEQYAFIFAYPCEPKFPKVLVRKWEQAGLKNNNRAEIRKEEAAVLGRLSLALALLFLGGVVLFISKLRRVGDGWKWTKSLAALLIVQFILLTIIAFMYFFLDTSMMFFGVSDSPADCFDFPLGTLFVVIFTGIVIGVLITRFLVFPLIKKNDIP
ncbi:glycosyl hydrolase family 18 protein [Flavitalea sp. BT771]|uniref:glycosyl hydrolase family 18 protein n=1 Tax=Flavitalea sp. BT771 TaxID=3063329 RepID=UPI0026E48ED6|nr:glycosyl hydrolase family 18 protein [Flavitalea sp. BT771]MDO6432103.1 glycosyl hydrolase family 18 protein [Flavitalea sp. BT771]MDV6221012.1 glycosyl hydrolase family 18 protein [Flavitalea sp. BT771]